MATHKFQCFCIQGRLHHLVPNLTDSLSEYSMELVLAVHYWNDDMQTKKMMEPLLPWRSLLWERNKLENEK